MDIILLVILSLSLILYGGFFVCISCMLSIILGGVFLYRICKNKKIVIPYNCEVVGLLLLIFMYALSAIWAVDKGIAIWGFIKYLPLLLFFNYLYQISSDKRNKVIDCIPYMSSVMVVISIVLLFIPMFREYFIVNGRLSGFFQYPNTFAIFLLISILILFFKENKKKYIDIIAVLICLVGIVLSKSLTVWGLSILAAIYLIVLWLYKQKSRKQLIIGFGIISIIIGINLSIIFSGVLGTILDTSLKASTFYGRLLYAYDGLNILKNHPLGLGYYGYYFMQGQYQTGVYSVTTVHNDFLQMLLDIGIVPGLVVIGIMIKILFSNNLCIRNRSILGIMILHALFDYDMQFIIMGVVMILFLPKGKTKEVEVTNITKKAGIIILIAVSTFSIKIGLSDILSQNGKYEAALTIYKGNTLAKIEQMQLMDDINQQVQIADEILSYNDNVPECYDIKAMYAYSLGNVDDIIENQEKAIHMQPYNIIRAEQYVNVMCECLEYFNSQGDYQTAEYCLKVIKKAIKEVEQLEEKTSYLGWKIKDKPCTHLDFDNELFMSMIEK